MRGLPVAILAAALVASCSASTTHAPAPTTTTAIPTTSTSTTTTTVDPGLLPQTTARPSATDPAFTARIFTLWQALSTGQPALGLPAFFPLTAYKQVKALPDPASDWQHRLIAQYDGDIVAVHRSLPPGAVFVDVSVPEADATWVPPGAEVNKIGYWRVYDSVVHYAAGGSTHSVVIISLISWRGQWYVVHFRTPPS